MKTTDISTYLVLYNFVIGVLLMISSEKLGSYAGFLKPSHQASITRFTKLSTFTFGTCVAVISGFIYIAFHVLRLGV
jgi:hypothetical protein